MAGFVNNDTSALDLPTPSFVPNRYRPDLSAWSGHLAFANDLIAAIQPSLIVELGTHWGESYFTFCQSVHENGLSCLCYAVDHWQGESHTGVYGEEVFRDVHGYNQTYYKHFSYLLRESFDEAVLQFADGSIDLLHIDGLHTYEAVRHDFRAWFKKIKAGGIVLLHDTAGRHEDFGVWRFWDELQAEFANTFDFHHSWGLGVMRKPGDQPTNTLLLTMLFDSSPAMRERIRRHYVLYAGYLDSILRAEKIPDTSAMANVEAVNTPVTLDEDEITQVIVRVYVFGISGYSEDQGLVQHAEFDKWENLSFILPPGTGPGPLRIDPVDCPAVIEISNISLVNNENNTVIWAAADTVSLGNIQLKGATSFKQDEGVYTLLSYNSDSQLILQIPKTNCTKMRLDISLRVHRTLTAAAGALDATTQALTKVVRAENEGRREIRMLQQLVDSANDRLREETLKTAGLRDIKRELNNMRDALQAERDIRTQMEQSRSWRITRPLRSFMHSVRTEG